MRKVPSVDEADDGVTAAEAGLEVDEVQPLALLLLLLLALPVLLPRLSSSAKRGRGKDMGRSVNRAGRSRLRGSVGTSSLSSQSGVPGRLLPSGCCRLFLVSTSQGMMRGRECFPLPVAPSPELSVESRDTLLLGRLLLSNEEEEDEVAPELPFPPVSLVGVVDEAVDPWPTAEDEDADGWGEEVAAARELADATDGGCADGRGSLVLTSLTPLSLLPDSFDFFFLAFLLAFLPDDEGGLLVLVSKSDAAPSSPSSPELMAPTRSSLKSRMRENTSADPLVVAKWWDGPVEPVSMLRPLLLLLPPLP